MGLKAVSIESRKWVPLPPKPARPKAPRRRSILASFTSLDLYKEKLKDVGPAKKKKKKSPITKKAQVFDPKTGEWKAAATGATKLRGKMGRLAKAQAKAPKYIEPDQGKRVAAKEVLSAKTLKPLKKYGPQTKVIFEYTYEDGTKYRSKAFKPSKVEKALFKATKLKDAHVHEPGETEQENESDLLVFEKCLDVPRGGDIATAREAMAALLGRFQLPKEGLFNILIFWKVYEDLLKENVLDAPPSKRFTVDAAKLDEGYENFLRSMLSLKARDLEEQMDLNFEEIEEEHPDAVKKWKRELARGKDVPKNTTRAYFEKQLLAMAQGRGVYISDKSYFKDTHGKAPKKKKGKKGKADPKPYKPETAEMSEICVKVWKLAEKKHKSKSKTKRGKK